MIVQEDGKHVVEAYSDADWAGCKVSRKSVSGSAFLVKWAAGLLGKPVPASDCSLECRI